MSNDPAVTLAQAVRQMRETLPAMLEINELQAQITRAKFKALVKQGFTEAQALYLCHPQGGIVP